MASMYLFLKYVYADGKEELKINEDAFYFYHYLADAIIHNRNDNIILDYVKCHDCKSLIYPSMDKTYVWQVEQKENKIDSSITSATNNVVTNAKSYLCCDCFDHSMEKEKFRKINQSEKTFLQIRMLNFPIFCPLCSQNIALQLAFVHAKEIHHCCMYYDKNSLFLTEILNLYCQMENKEVAKLKMKGDEYVTFQIFHTPKIIIEEKEFKSQNAVLKNDSLKHDKLKLKTFHTFKTIIKEKEIKNQNTDLKSDSLEHDKLKLKIDANPNFNDDILEIGDICETCGIFFINEKEKAKHMEAFHGQKTSFIVIECCRCKRQISSDLIDFHESVCMGKIKKDIAPVICAKCGMNFPSDLINYHEPLCDGSLKKQVEPNEFKNIIVCAQCQCKYLQRDSVAHEKLCPEKDLICQDCLQFYCKNKTKALLDLHHLECSMVKISCLYDCGYSCQRSEMKKHEGQCSLKVITCLKCGFTCKLIDLQSKDVTHDFENCKKAYPKNEDVWNKMDDNELP
jgi:hypothetical protein